MAYQVLARKWRPRNFHEVMGQQHVLQALSNALDQGRLHHAYLFSGTRGVGKTTIARILAKCLNCETGITSRPCGQCSACKEIEQGNFVDLLEIDAASRTKVEDTRDLLDNVQYKPARGRFKIYLIDEVHMLSRHSFNALLKTLEEPPEHVKFLLATTDPQKLPVTILSRCLQFHLKALTRQQIIDQLQRVLQAEQLTFEPEALGLLAKAAQGSMRDALSLSDQAIAYGNGILHADTVQQMLGTLDHRQLHQLLSLLAARNGAALMQQIGELAELAPDYDQLHIELASLLHRTAMWQLLGQHTEPGAEDVQALQQLAEQLPPEEIQLYYQIALTGRKELPLAPDGRSALEMTFLRMLAFAPREGTQTYSQPVISPVRTKEPAQSAPVSQTAVTMPSLSAAVPEITQPMVDDDLAMQAKLRQEQAELMAQAEQQMPARAPSMNQESANSSVAPVMPESERSQSGVQDILRLRNQLRSRRQQAENQTESHITPVVAPVRQPQTPVSAVADSSHEVARQPDTIVLPNGGNLPPSAQDDLPPWELPPLDAYQDSFIPADNPTAMVAAAPPSRTVPPRQINTVPAMATTVTTAPTARLPELDENDDSVWRSNELLLRSQDAWAQTVAQLPVGGRVRQLAMQAIVTSQEPDRWHLQIRNEARHLAQSRIVQELAEALSATLPQPINVQVEPVAQLSLPCPAEIEQQERVRLQQDAELLFQSDPNVQFLQQRFGATLDDGSIQPLKIETTASGHEAD
ncbi:DNA polymerase III subunit gamma/tau [Tolumonas lignilytica]|uniref:DNA polymerase III subunit gamma/tau n=1 Tax=Tolumonas lignilytica TaxID=1283284 RepID=UPI0004669DF1|nr:DNA polymerase III subunit gamma/tau [Tolumonas lignilytica]